MRRHHGAAPLSLAYKNCTTATPAFAGAGCTIQLLWRRSGGALEVVPREAIHVRGRRDYYAFGGAVVAMKDGVMNAAPRVLSYLHGDHLGSASMATNASGQKVSEQRYKPYGEVRWSSGPGMPTDKQFTGQTRLAEGYVGTLYDYVARAYDPVLGRFISADTIVPGAGNPQAFNRYTYVGNSPLGHRDPSGHAQDDPDDGGCGYCGPSIPPPGPIGPPPSSIPIPSAGSSTVPFGGSQSTPGFDAYAPSLPIPTRVYQVWGQSTVYRTDTLGGALLSALDDQLWSVPSAVGFQLFGWSVDASGGLGGSLAGNGTLWLNWRSGELGIVKGGGGSLGVAIGGDLSAGGGAGNGVSLAWGASSLGPIAGPNYQATLTGKAAAAFGVKGEVSLSVSYDDKAGLPAIDPVSGKNISTLGVGVNYLTLGAGASGAVLFSPPQWNNAEVSWRKCLNPQFCR